ncbi:hypothetical protein [Lewinella sp. IMCC34183]|uniref:hypothetical protein n=1 Tax=Lewinella sp. IMCC34183 TaxID=2248762 RepID=UPI00130021AA|nr:hypothetical protein [Lewinella sp. IMCC34183]
MDYLIRALKLAKELVADVAPDAGSLNILIEEGSLLLRNAYTEAPEDYLTQRLIAFGGNYRLAAVGEHAAEALQGLRQLAASHGDTVSILNGSLELTSLTSETEFVVDERQWTQAELYVRGFVTNVGGKQNPNIHLDVNDDRFGKLIVAATREQIAKDQTNRLYKPLTLRISILQDRGTGNYDPGSAKLIDYVETGQADDNVSGYLDQLIERAAASWKQVTDKDSWLRDIRGYGG